LPPSLCEESSSSDEDSDEDLLPSLCEQSSSSEEDSDEDSDEDEVKVGDSSVDDDEVVDSDEVKVGGNSLLDDEVADHLVMDDTDSLCGDGDDIDRERRPVDIAEELKRYCDNLIDVRLRHNLAASAMDSFLAVTQGFLERVDLATGTLMPATWAHCLARSDLEPVTPQKIHACPKDHFLYYGDAEGLDRCVFFTSAPP
jgi:hypothetical protein